MNMKRYPYHATGVGARDSVFPGWKDSRWCRNKGRHAFTYYIHVASALSDSRWSLNRPTSFSEGTIYTVSSLPLTLAVLPPMVYCDMFI